jgi:putative PIN family toxin of toxin-antitoxin system
VRIVADTNVLVSGLLTAGGGPGALLSSLDAGEVILVAAPGLLDELDEVLARDRFRTWASIEQIEAYVGAIQQRVEWVEDPDEITPVSREPAAPPKPPGQVTSDRKSARMWAKPSRSAST